MDTQVYIQLAYALGIGVLMGLERSFVVEGGKDPARASRRGGAGPTTVGGAGPDKAAADAGSDTTAADDSGEEGGAEGPAGARGTAPEGSPGSAAEAFHGTEPVAALAVPAGEDDVTGGGEFPGVRTFSVLSLLGFSGALLGERYDLAAPVVLGAAALLVIAMYRRATHMGTGITTEAAAIGACALGMLCHYDHQMAGAIGVVLTVLLVSKRFAHSTVQHMRRVELTDTLKFLVAIVIILPLLPDEALDPYEAFNPYKVGFLVVLISGISFVGYFLTRILGAKKGLGLTGILGGLTSSTAVTAAMAAEARSAPQLRSICAFSTVAANATMFVRVLVVVALLDMPLAMQLAWPIGAMAAVAVVAAIALWLAASRTERADDETGGKVKLKNPFSVGPALKFGAFFVLILFAAKLAKIYFGDKGLYAAATVSGLADVDAITLSIAEQTAAEELLRNVGAIGITIAVVSNSVVKTAIAIYSGGFKFGRLVALALGAATGVGLVVALLL